MMRKLMIAGIAMMTIAISSCDEDTLTLGDTLTNNIDKFQTVSQTYQVKTRTIKTDSVLARTIYNYLGKIKDPETGSYVTSDYMTQFNILESQSSAVFPPTSMIAKDESGNPYVDSCVIRIMINSYQGDSLAAMKMQMSELDKPVPKNAKYYSNFDPEKEGYLRTVNPLKKSKLYAVSDLTQSDSLRNVLRGSGYYQYITIPLNQSYTDKNGTTYEGHDSSKKRGSGFGNYLLRNYYNHPEYYKNSTTFAYNLCPGFYFKSTDGLGNMMEVANTQIIVYYHFTRNDSTINATRAIVSTDEVLQTNHITNDKNSIAKLEAIDTCTFLKTPSGLFTEVELPIDSIKWLRKDGVSHENDTIMQAKVIFQQYKTDKALSNKLLEAPSDLLLVPRDSLYTFFESNSIPNNISTYMATYNSTQKSYTYSTLSSLVDNIYSKMKPSIMNDDGFTVNLDKVEAYKKAHPNWNKVVLVPVDYITTYTSSTTSTITGVYNSMAISSVRLVGGSNNKHAPITMTVIYSKNE